MDNDTALYTCPELADLIDRLLAGEQANAPKALAFRLKTDPRAADEG